MLNRYGESGKVSPFITLIFLKIVELLLHSETDINAATSRIHEPALDVKKSADLRLGHKVLTLCFWMGLPFPPSNSCTPLFLPMHLTPLREQIKPASFGAFSSEIHFTILLGKHKDLRHIPQIHIKSKYFYNWDSYSALHGTWCASWTHGVSTQRWFLT